MALYELVDYGERQPPPPELSAGVDLSELSFRRPEIMDTIIDRHGAEKSEVVVNTLMVMALAARAHMDNRVWWQDKRRIYEIPTQKTYLDSLGMVVLAGQEWMEGKVENQTVFHDIVDHIYAEFPEVLAPEDFIKHLTNAYGARHRQQNVLGFVMPVDDHLDYFEDEITNSLTVRAGNFELHEHNLLTKNKHLQSRRGALSARRMLRSFDTTVDVVAKQHFQQMLWPTWQAFEQAPTPEDFPFKLFEDEILIHFATQGADWSALGPQSAAGTDYVPEEQTFVDWVLKSVGDKRLKKFAPNGKHIDTDESA